MQGTVIWPLIMSAAVWVMAISSGVRGLKSAMKLVLSRSCSMLLMPESTIITFSCEAAKRIAQEGMEASGSAFLNILSAASGSFARVPPLTGSITTTGLWCFVAVSYTARDWIHSLSQSR